LDREVRGRSGVRGDRVPGRLSAVIRATAPPGIPVPPPGRSHFRVRRPRSGPVRANTRHRPPSPGANMTRPTTRRLRLEPLEGRDVPATFTVTNTDDSGGGSLRQAITDANNHVNSGGPDR